MKRINLLVICMLVVSIFSLSSISVAQILKVIKEKPLTVTGILGYATMKYRIEIQKGKSIELWPDEDNALDAQLSDMIGKKVTLTGIMKTYQDGSKYLHISRSGVGTSNKKTDSGTFAMAKEDHAILFNGRIAYQNDDCFSLSIEKVFSIGIDKVALVMINSGGTACPATYVFITAKSSGTPLLSKEFGNCSDILKIIRKGNKITLKFPGNPPETWTYQNGNVRKGMYLQNKSSTAGFR